MWQGYTNADNPFGDEHLLDTFVWQKKLEKEGKSDLGQADLEKIQKTKMMESKVPILYITIVCTLVLSRHWISCTLWLFTTF